MSGWWFPAVKSLEWLLWRWVMAVIRDKTGKKKKNSCAIFHLRGADVLPESKLKSVPVRGGVRLCGREIRGELWPGSRKRNLLGSFYFFSSNSSFLLFPLIFLSLTIIFRNSFIFFFYSIFMFLCFIFLCYFFLISFLFSLSSIPEVLPSLCFPFSFCSSYIFSSTVILIFVFSL